MVSKSFEGQTDKTEEWYGTQYKQESISDEVIKVRCSSLSWIANGNNKTDLSGSEKYM